MRSQEGRNAVAMAARRGRGDILALFQARGTSLALDGVDRLIAACAMDNGAAIEAIRQTAPLLVTELQALDGTVLAEFAGNGNTEGVRHLLDLGVDAGAVFEHGDGYWDVAPRSTALHVAAWRMRPAVVALLIAREAPVDARDRWNRTPPALAVKASIDSYWSERRAPDSVAALLAAGASVDGIAYPSGYDDVDRLLRGTVQDRGEPARDARRIAAAS